VLPIFIRQGWPQAMSHLSEMDDRALCYPAFSQVALLHEWHRDGVNHTPSSPAAVAVYWRTLARCTVS
jgi:hypothetical protein